jgi:thiamine-monophosphate kinase
MSVRGEFDVIRSIRAAAGEPGPGVVVGIGDDCAVLAGDATSDLLVTTDLLVEGRHFAASAAPEDVGWKALAVSISDVAAMGGKPEHAVLSLAMKPKLAGSHVDRLVRGVLDCAARFGVSLVGGDTNATDGPLVVSITLMGRVAKGRAVLRSGAKAGDALCVTGSLGGSAAGRHLRPTPRVAEAAALVAGGDVHAMIDVSDGLSSDLSHVVEASGVGAEIWADRIPLHADALAATKRDKRPTIEHALDDGEDFELLFAVPPDRATALVASGLQGTRVSRIGTILDRRGMVILDSEKSDASAFPLLPRGFDHFKRA